MSGQPPIGERFSRTAAVIGLAGLERLRASRVAVFGIGGVGAACAEALVRGGVGTVALVDHDTVSPSDLNRQLIATGATMGQQKTEAAKRRYLEIAPDADIRVFPVFYESATMDRCKLADYDAAADCVDTLSAKLLLAAQAADSGCYLVSCMGTGNRLDPMMLRFADIYQTQVCPLARRMRKACRDQGIPALRVLYSQEEPVRAVTLSQHGRHAPGSVSFVPPAAGLMMAGDIIRHLLSRPDDPSLPVPRPF